MDTLINTNEVLLKENETWLHFSNLYRQIWADELDEVMPALRELEDLIKINGWHAAGFISYEAAPAFDKAHRTKASFRPERRDAYSMDGLANNPVLRLRSVRGDFPYLWFGLYPPPHVITLPGPASAQQALTWLPTVDRESYNSAIEQIRSLIAEGQTYQVNYTLRLRTEFKIDAWNFFLQLAQSQNSHAAYVDTGRYVICSASPELFFQLDGETITCRPMKGTIRRGRTTLEDSEQAQTLKDSEKNRAENVMIVDMIRNDLGRIARIGSVHVPELFTVEKYSTLWQMTSTVTAKTNASLPDIFTALFPCASITGAPKVSTMRIISELETTPRRVYTGSIGYIAPNRKANFNVAIRTAVIDRVAQNAEYGVGGGIVWDSSSADEYTEALLKARVLTEQTPTFALLETMRWTPEEGFFLREKHIVRLLDSANYFEFPISKELLEPYLNKILSQFTSPQRVRLLLDKNGKLNSETQPLQPLEDRPPLRVCIAKEPVHSGNIFLYHKTTHREIYEAACKDFPAYDDVLLYNEHGELTEFTIGNLVVEIDGTFFTPPLSCGLLAGTFRAHILETGQVEERIIRVEELIECTKIFLVNAVRKWQRAILL